MMIIKCSALLFHIILWTLTKSEFTPDFTHFLNTQYGNGISQRLGKRGIGLNDDFGGKKNHNEVVKNEPVIFVPGVTLHSGTFSQHFDYFKAKGYSNAELYSTSYGDGGFTPMFDKEMACDDVKRIRNFIKSIHNYTQSRVDIIAYSMGSAIARKAILGGRCVDTNENLGPPLTNIVDTFVSVAGIAYGVEKCAPYHNACNVNNGIICDSDYLRDINRPNYRYEGQFSFYIYSDFDFVIGQRCCGNFCAELKNANGASSHDRIDHNSIITATKEIQFAMVNHQKYDNVK